MSSSLRTSLCATLAVAAIILTGTLAGAETTFLRTISLNSTEDVPSFTYQVPTGKSVRIQNDMDRVLHNTSIARLDPDKHMVSVHAFHPGQSMDLEFTAQGAYSICYEWALEHTTHRQRSCVRVNVVKLQST
ncbi:hypothetical protein [Nitrospina watsonii]|uniref:EfeO-type cupredoxin-like domain-containing protein n=1 Tax=Nitrospina watsonii TaxID=1323948 RepID=A0ABN8W5L5_9BACT|nr:hypothetical protein [Nitrospina watsonii]CAI2718931.1 conserved protein of unknown function [Nitrospina watsonii]